MSIDVSPRDGSCIVDTDLTPFGADGPTWVSRCGCGREWPLGKTREVCGECVLGRCAHPKAGVPVEQGTLL